MYEPQKGSFKANEHNFVGLKTSDIDILYTLIVQLQMGWDKKHNCRHTCPPANTFTDGLFVHR